MWSCSSARMSAAFSPCSRVRMRVEQVERVLRGSPGAAGRAASAAYSAMCAPPRRPNTTMSRSEFVPRRFAPCTLTQAHSPAAYRPGTGVSSGPITTWPSVVGGDPAHRVVGRGLDRHRLLRRLDAQVHARELRDVGELLLDHLGRQVREVEVHHVPVRPGAAALLDLLVDRAAHHVARREVLDRGRVALHEALAVLVANDRALAARRLRQQHAELVQARRVELEHLHVLERDAAPQHDRRPVAGERVRVRRDPEHPPVAAGGEQHGLGPEHVDLAGRELVRDDAAARAVGHQQVQAVELVEEANVALHALLIQGLQDHVAGAIGGVARALDRPPRRGCACGRRTGAGRSCPSGVRLNGRPQCSSW